MVLNLSVAGRLGAAGPSRVHAMPETGARRGAHGDQLCSCPARWATVCCVRTLCCTLPSEPIGGRALARRWAARECEYDASPPFRL